MGFKETDMLSFIHLSDPHLRESPDTTTNGINPYTRLEDTIESIKILEYNPKFAIITGDLSQNGTAQGYEQLKQHTIKLENQNIQTLLTFGNNDKMGNYKQVFKTQSNTKTLNYEKDIEGIRIIVLDSSVPGKSTGYFREDQLRWMKKVLHKEPGKPTVIAFHHPIILPQVRIMDINFDKAQRLEFYNALEGCNIVAILNGHLHHNQVTIENGILHSQAGSVLTELSYNDEEYWVKNKSSYNYLRYRNNSLHIKTISRPYDERVLLKGSLKTLIQDRLKPK